MSASQTKYPQLRFKGFTDPWEQRKLGEVGKTQSGIGFPDAEQGGTEGVPFYKVSDMNKPGNEHEMVNANNYVNYEQLSRKKWKIIETVPAVIFAKVGAAIMLNRKRLVTSPFLIDNNTMAYVFDGSWNIDFGKTLFETINLPRYAQVGALPSYNGSDIESIEVTLPNKGEQVKLGAFFKSLDDTITLHQRKLAKLKELKQGYLQKLFPENGSKFPQLRFAGFADAWEQRKLSDGTNKIGDGLHGTPKYSEDGEVYFVNGNNLVNGQIVIMPETKTVTSNEQSKDDKALNESTILMSINGTIGNLAWYRGENLMLGKSAAYIEVSDFDKKFIYAYLQTRPVKDYYLNSLTGTTIKNLGLKAIRNTNICTPTIDEQAKIGVLFQNLDKTITLHQRKLERLQELKKGYLQKMFC